MIRYIKLCIGDRVLRWNEKRKELEDGRKTEREKAWKGERERERELKICFWNVAGLRHLCENTWEYLEGFDVIGLTETWLKEEKKQS